MRCWDRYKVLWRLQQVALRKEGCKLTLSLSLQRLQKALKWGHRLFYRLAVSGPESFSLLLLLPKVSPM